jgi:hypothetical protein
MTSKAKAVERGKEMGVRSRKLSIARDDFPDMADAIFEGDHEMPGAVSMFANSKGRGHINALFPQGVIAWGPAGPGLPEDWQGCHLDDLLGIIAAQETRVPLEVMAGCNFVDINPVQLAFLLAVGVKRDGGRAAIIIRRAPEFEVEILMPRQN